MIEPPDRPPPGDPYPPPGPYGPGEPAYPPPGPGGGGYGWGHPAPPARTGLAERLGGRLLRRPETRFSVTLAGAGAALLLLGAFLWSLGFYLDRRWFTFNGDGLTSDSGGSRRFLGFVLFVGLAVAGFAVAAVRRHGPLASAAAVCAAFGVPLALVFLTLDPGGMAGGDGPVNLDAVMVVSIAAWLISYFLVPGLRGRALFLAAAATWIYSYLGYKAAGGPGVTSGAAVFGVTGGGADSGAVTGIGLVFGLSYYGIAAVLDRLGRHGAAVALVVAGFLATAGGILGGAPDLGLAGSGVLLILVGALLAWYGARFGRRFTAWVWGAGVVAGFVLVVVRIFRDSYTGAGITLMVLGVLVVLGAHALAGALHEPPDVREAGPPPVYQPG